MNIRGLQQEAAMAYNRLHSEDAGPYLQAYMQAEIAVQLQKLHEELQRIANALELLEGR